MFYYCYCSGGAVGGVVASYIDGVDAAVDAIGYASCGALNGWFCFWCVIRLCG